MRPKTLSASSIKVAQLCMARWKAEYFERGGGFSGTAANTGTACHGALELFVQAVFIDKKILWDDLGSLEIFYMKSFTETFGHADFNSPEYKDGWTLVKKWHKRTDLSDVHRVVSVEQKHQFDVPVKFGIVEEKIPLSYIMDRLDEMDPDCKVIRVVDYKTIRIPINPDELHSNVQARIYALMAQIKYPKAERIWVVFDLLRHDTVGTVFTREDNIETWEFLKREAQRIADTPVDKAPETLNAECRFCVRAATCKTLNSNVAVGGVFSLSQEEIARKKLEIEHKIRGLESLVEKFNDALLQEARQRDELEWVTTDGVKVEIRASRSRKVNWPVVAKILGPDIMAREGKMNLTQLDQILEAPGVLTEDQKSEIQKLIWWEYGDASAKVKEKK